MQLPVCIFIVARAGKCRCCSGTAPHAAEKRAKRRRKARQTPQKSAPNHWEPVRESIEFHGESEHAAAVVVGGGGWRRVVVGGGGWRRQWWWVAAGGGGSAAVLSRTNVMIIQAFVAVGVLRHV